MISLIPGDLSEDKHYHAVVDGILHLILNYVHVYANLILIIFCCIAGAVLLLASYY